MGVAAEDAVVDVTGSATAFVVVPADADESAEDDDNDDFAEGAGSGKNEADEMLMVDEDPGTDAGGAGGKAEVTVGIEFASPSECVDDAANMGEGAETAAGEEVVLLLFCLSNAGEGRNRSNSKGQG